MYTIVEDAERVNIVSAVDADTSFGFNPFTISLISDLMVMFLLTNLICSLMMQVYYLLLFLLTV